MDWQGVGVIVAMLAVALSFVMTWRGQKQERDIAEASAARSEAAARLSADSSERVVIALEAIASKEFAPNATTAPVPPRVGWTLSNYGGDTYILTNVGDATAYGVDVSAHESMMGPNRINGGPDLEAGEALTFLAVRTFGTKDSTIQVTWLDDPVGTERREWRYPLPPRPPRH